MRRIVRRIALPMACFILTGAGAAQAQGDPEQGEKVFAKCQACHAVDEAENGVGPHLVDIFGREAGSLEDYRYSSALEDSSIVWEDETIAEYVKAPRDLVPGTKMVFAGLKDDEEIADLLAYLHAANGG
jgi:cytochrome c2